MTPSSPRNPVRCPYCCKFYDPKKEMTDDHVIASASGIRLTRRTTFQRYTVRACRGCNERFGAIEGDILHHLAVWSWTLKTQQSDLSSRARGGRSIRRQQETQLTGRNVKRGRRSLQNDMVDASDVPLHKVAAWTLPNIRSGQPTLAIRVPTTLAHVVEKWVRGIYHKTTRSFLPDAYAVQSVPVTDEAEAENLEFIRRRGQVLAQGPGIAVTQWIERQNEVLYAIYSFTIWDVFSVYAAAHTLSHKPIREMLITRRRTMF